MAAMTQTVQDREDNLLELHDRVLGDFSATTGLGLEVWAMAALALRKVPKADLPKLARAAKRTAQLAARRVVLHS